MASTATYIPGTHCAVCVQLGRLGAAVVTIVFEHRDYLACDEHAGLITIRGIRGAILHAKRNPTKGAV